MDTIQNQTLVNKTVLVDGNRYENCRFVDCQLLYKGGDLPAFVRCEFNGVSIQLEDDAALTLSYLTGLYHGGLSGPVDTTLDMIDRGLSQPRRVRSEQRVAEAVGANYGQLAVLNLTLIIITIAIIGGLFYAFEVYPNQELLGENQPLTEQIPLSSMPSLPDELTEAYDVSRADQIDRLHTYRWVNEEAGVVTVPIEDAITLLVEEGPPDWSAE